MKRKVLMIMLCMGLSFAMITACGNADPVNEEEAQSEEEEETEEEESEEPEEEEEEAPEEEVTEVVENEMATEDAFDLFLADELTVTVDYPEWMEVDQYLNYPSEGEYTYSELIASLIIDAPLTYDIQYTTFTPVMGDDEILALYAQDTSDIDYSWMGFIAYTNNELVMKYTDSFGYRSYFELYEGGYVLEGGSGGAGASYADCGSILPDSSYDKFYESGHFWSSWCDEASYYLDSELSYDLRPSIPMEDEDFEIIVAVGAAAETVMYVANRSEDESMREAEDAFISALEGMGMVVVDDESEVSLDVIVDSSSFVPVEWNYIETIENN